MPSDGCSVAGVAIKLLFYKRYKMSKLKNGCVTELSSEMHEKYDVTNLPYQNLNPTHPVRMAWESKEVEDAKLEEREIRKFGDCKGEVNMRPSDKVNGREFSLSPMASWYVPLL